VALEFALVELPDFELAFERGRQEHCRAEVSHAGDFALVGVGDIVVLLVSKVVEAHVLEMGVRVVLGVVEEVVLVVVEVVVAVGVGESKLEDIGEQFGLAVEVEEVDVVAVAEGEVVLVVGVELGEFGEGVEGQVAQKVQSQHRLLAA
jgi:hypothetical protein